MPPNKRGVIYLDKATWRSLRVTAAKHGLSMGEVLTQLMRLVDGSPDGRTLVDFDDDGQLVIKHAPVAIEGKFVRDDTDGKKGKL